MRNPEEAVCTVVSIVPFAISETKPGLIPPYYSIPASENGEPQTLVVSQAMYYVYQRDDRSIQVRVTPYDIAKSIVRDVCASQIAFSEENTMTAPGIFWVVGEYNSEEIKQKFPDLLERANQQQRNWFVELCKMADSDWQKFRQPNVISQVQRIAGSHLGYSVEQHPWMEPYMVLQNKPEESLCPACGVPVRPGIVVCPSCRAVLDEEKYKTFKFAS